MHQMICMQVDREEGRRRCRAPRTINTPLIDGGMIYGHDEDYLKACYYCHRSSAFASLLIVATGLLLACCLQHAVWRKFRPRCAADSLCSLHNSVQQCMCRRCCACLESVRCA